MRKTVIILSVLAVVLSGCKQATDKTADRNEKYNTQNITPPDSCYHLLESFVDSTQIGKKGDNKIEISKYVNNSNDDCFVRIFFYSKEKYNDVNKTNWWSCNDFIFEGCVGLFPKISDFNNDGYNDFTYHSFEGARGANDTRKLFIYNPEKDEFIYIKNSENYPNLSYNKELDCINAFAFYGCNATYFLKLQSDSLHLLASVELCGNGELTVQEFDKYGNEKSIKHKINNEFERFVPFTNYNPLKQ